MFWFSELRDENFLEQDLNLIEDLKLNMPNKRVVEAPYKKVPFHTMFSLLVRHNTGDGEE